MLSQQNSDSRHAVRVHEQSTPIASLEDLPVVSIKIEKLTLDGSPRLAGEDLEHARLLASIHSTLPPITVRQQTMQVIDGRHRIHAALLNGQSVIDARLVECDERTGYVLAVRENVAHGLPLSLADRRAAAVTIITSHPHWSDRVVAEQTGLSDKTVSALRTSAPGSGGTEQNARLGRDGRLRPLNSAARRRPAAALIQEDPSVGLREIARATGLSPSTVRDVRTRINDGKDPVPARYSDSERDETAAVPPVGVAGVAGVANTEPAGAPRRSAFQFKPVNRDELMAKLMGDPSLKFNNSGRNLLRWLDRYTVSSADCRTLAPNIPDHWALPLADLARSCANAWAALAEQLEQRSEDAGPARQYDS